MALKSSELNWTPILRLPNITRNLKLSLCKYNNYINRGKQSKKDKNSSKASRPSPLTALVSSLWPPPPCLCLGLRHQGHLHPQNYQNMLFEVKPSEAPNKPRLLMAPDEGRTAGLTESFLKELETPMGLLKNLCGYSNLPIWFLRFTSVSPLLVRGKPNIG